MLRWICGKTMIDMIPNGVFRAELDVDSIVDKMRVGRLRLFGHVKRRPRNAPVKRVEAMKVEGSSINPYAHVYWPEVHWKQSLYYWVILKVGVRSVYTSPPPYPDLAGLGKLLLLYAIPKLKFNSRKDAKTLMEAIKKRFGGNTKTKKVQKTLLKQQYENFTSYSSESLDQIHDRLQKLVSQLEIHGVSLSQEDVNLKFLRISAVASVSTVYAKMPVSFLPNVDSLSNAVIYSFFASQSFSPQLDNEDLKQIDIDDLEEMDLRWQMAMLTMRARRFLQKTGRNLGANGPTSMGFDMSKVECYNCHRKGHFARKFSAVASVSTVYAKMPVSSLPNVDSLSNAVIYSFFASQSFSPQLDNEDLKQIDIDDLEEMDLRWQMAMLTMRARRFLQKTGRNLGANRPTSMGFDMSKVECYNCHRNGHFARKCRSPKDSRRNEVAEPQRRSVPRRSLPIMLLWIFLSLSSSSDNEVPSCSNACSKAYAQLHSQYDKLIADFCKSQFDVISYQTESDESWPSSSLYDRFQPSDGYHTVHPQYTGTFMLPKPDLVFNTAPTAVETDHYAFAFQLSPTKPDQDLSHPNRPSSPIIEDWVFDFEDESETKEPQIVPSFVQSTKQVKSPRHSVQHVETSILAATPKPSSPKHVSSGKRRNRKACFVCKSLDHLIKDCDYHAKKWLNPLQGTMHTGSKPASITAVRPVSAAVPKIKVTRPKQVQPIVTKPKSPIRRHITHSPSPKTSNSPLRVTAVKAPVGNPQHDLKDKGVIDSGCSRHMTGNMSYLSDFKELNCRYVAFGGNSKGGKISRKGKIRTGKLDFDDVYFVKELKFNLFSVLQMCDKKNSVLFTDTECLVLSPDYKLPDESQVLLRVPRENNMYTVNLKNIVPSGYLTCLFAKATIDESNLWHRRPGHINFKTINKLVKGNLFRGLPTNVFENDNTCVACKKGKKHIASYKTKPVSSVDQPLYRLHMDLFGPTFVKSLNKKSYCLVVTDDYSSPILKNIITGLENQLSLRVKVIKSDNGTEFKNNDLNQLCGIKGIKREFSVPRTPQQNGITERKNRTLIEAARTMLADSLLPIPFWVEAVNTACYVQNKVLVTKPHNKTPYELLHGRTPSIGFMRPFGCLVTILNTLDSLGKFDGKVDEGFLVGYSPNVAGSGPTWLFDIDSLTRTMNYQPVTVGNQANPSAGFQDKFAAEKAREAIDQQYMLFPVWSSGSTSPQNTDRDAAFNGKKRKFNEKKPESEVNVSPSSNAQSRKLDDKTKKEAKGKSPVESFTGYRDLSAEFKDCFDNSINEGNAADASQLPDDHDMPGLEDITYSDDEDDVGVEADFNNLETSITVSPIPTTRVHKDDPVS
nr:putative ribonuclease H-like domain-containing protein [Tanacetum cinerariifolium]